jgi:predicted  nucleic acid-binding Zn-ribbon protein
MRWTIAAVLGVCLLMLTACQDNEARMEIQRLQNELASAKSGGGSNDDLLKLLLATREGNSPDESLNRRLNTLLQDMEAGFSSTRKAIADGRNESDQRIRALEERLARVGDFETTLSGLRSAIESLESKGRNLDPNQVLEVEREKMRLEARLESESTRRESIEAEAARLSDEVKALQQAVVEAEGRAEGLAGEDISRHPMFIDQRRKLTEAQAELARARSDFENLERKYNALLEQLRQGARPPRESDPDAPRLDPDNYRFMGNVGTVRVRPNRPSYLIVTIRAGSVPPVDTELLVLDSRNQRVCMVRVVQHFHADDNPDLPVDELGCVAIDETSGKPITEGDTVVWVRGEDRGEEAREGRREDGREGRREDGREDRRDDPASAGGE